MIVRTIALACYVLALAGVAALALLILTLGLDARPSWIVIPLPYPWLVNTTWLVVFGVQHSIMARESFKRRWTRIIPPILERSVYVGLSGLLTLGMVLTWQPLPGEPLWRLSLWLIVVPLAAGLGVVLVNRHFDHFEFLGLRQVWEQGRPPAAEKLLVVGAYRYVRHPLMACLLVFLWVQPVMTPALAFLSAGLTVYVAVGVALEERDLLRQFGAAYRDYRRRVPALVPYRRPAPPAEYSPLRDTR